MNTSSRRIALLAMVSLLVFAPPFVSPTSAPAGVCNGQGTATLELLEPASVAGRLRMRVTGRRFARLALLADAGAGPVTRPQIGTFCLDFGPQFKILVDGIRNGTPRIGSDGTYETDLRVPNRPSLAGRTFFVQALLVDNNAPNGYAISNMVTITASDAIVEKFDTTLQRDVPLTSAVWTGNGQVKGKVSTTPRTISYDPQPLGGFLLPQPLVAQNDPFTTGCRFMMKYEPSLLGIVRGESVLAMNWGPQSNVVFGSAYLAVKLRLGHFARNNGSSLSPFFNQNFAVDLPTRTVHDGNYSLPAQGSLQWQPWPSFSNPFRYDSSRALVFEVDMPFGGTTFQLFRNTSTTGFPINRIFGDGGANLAISTPENTTYAMQFTVQQDRAYAQSKFYDTTKLAPDYHTPILKTEPLPAGTSVLWQVEGASNLADPNTYTGFKSDADLIDGNRFVRFVLILSGDTTTADVATVTSLVLPFD